MILPGLPDGHPDLVSPLVAGLTKIVQWDGLPDFIIPGGIRIAANSAEASATSGAYRYYPIFVSQPFTFDALAIRVDFAQANAKGRIGLYGADVNLQPTRLIVDAGEIDASTTGIKTLAFPPITISKGVYMLAQQSNTTQYNPQVFSVAHPNFHLQRAGIINFIRYESASITYGGLLTTAPLITSATPSDGVFRHHVLMRPATIVNR